MKKIFLILVFLGLVYHGNAQEIGIKETNEPSLIKSIEQKSAAKKHKKELKKSRDQQKKAKKSQRKAEKALNKKKRAQKTFDKSAKKLESAQKSYETLKSRGRLSPMDEEKWLKKINRLEKNKKKAVTKLRKA